jgi:hypothetical protein
MLMGLRYNLLTCGNISTGKNTCSCVGEGYFGFGKTSQQSAILLYPVRKPATDRLFLSIKPAQINIYRAAVCLRGLIRNLAACLIMII